MNDPPENETSERKGLLHFIWENKIWWMTPTLIVIILLVVIMVMTQGTSIAPFFYSIF